MSDKQILDQIIANNKFEEAVNLNSIEIVEKLFNQLNDREKDVLKRRFGLHGKNKETLEEIGKSHSLTRERIRQIETGSVSKIKKNAEMESIVSSLRKVVSQLLEEHAGLISKDYLFDILVNLSVKDNVLQDDKTHRNYLNFLISKILNDDFDKVSNAKQFIKFFKFKHQNLDHIEDIAKELSDKIKELGTLHTTKDLINLTKELESFKESTDKFTYSNNIDINNILNSKNYSELDNDSKAIYSLLRVINDIDQNKFGYWGHNKSREIKPKTINDKIYLVLKNHGEPLSYGNIAEKIREIKFDSKPVNTATTHNELILDDKYVLIGRGLYGLKEWGYKTGTVSDVIAEILKESNEALTKDEITKKVLDQRTVKQTTINLALMNKDKFTKTNGKYNLKTEQL